MQILNQAATQFPRNVLAKLISLNPDQSRLLTVSHMIGTQTAQDVDHPYQFEWFVQRPRARHVEAAAAALVGDTSITLVAGHQARLTSGQKLQNTRTGEIIRLPIAAGTPFSGTTVIQNLERSAGTTPAAAVNAGDKFLILPSVRTEVSPDPTPQGFAPESRSNYLEETSKSAGASFRMQHAKQYAGWSFTHEQQEIADEYRMEMDRNLLVGELAYTADPTDTYIYTTTQGLLPSITTNVDALPAVPDWPTFQRIIRPHIMLGSGGRYGTKRKHALVSPAWMQWARSLPTAHINFDVPMKLQDTEEDGGFSFGWNVTQLNVNNVRLFLHVVDWWEDFGEAGSPYDYKNLFVVLDKNHIGVRYYKNGGVKLMKGRQANNVMTENVCWHSMYGFQLTAQESCGYFTAPVAG